jgi:hypothetical protein
LPKSNDLSKVKIFQLFRQSQNQTHLVVVVVVVVLIANDLLELKVNIKQTLFPLDSRDSGQNQNKILDATKV